MILKLRNITYFCQVLFFSFPFYRSGRKEKNRKRRTEVGRGKMVGMKLRTHWKIKSVKNSERKKELFQAREIWGKQKKKKIDFISQILTPSSLPHSVTFLNLYYVPEIYQFIHRNIFEKTTEVGREMARRERARQNNFSPRKKNKKKSFSLWWRHDQIHLNAYWTCGGCTMRCTR